MVLKNTHRGGPPHAPWVWGCGGGGVPQEYTKTDRPKRQRQDKTILKRQGGPWPPGASLGGGAGPAYRGEF